MNLMNNNSRGVAADDIDDVVGFLERVSLKWQVAAFVVLYCFYRLSLYFLKCKIYLGRYDISLLQEKCA